jgi:hypothetical protein
VASIDKSPTLSKGWPARIQDILNCTNFPTKWVSVLYKQIQVVHLYLSKKNKQIQVV